MSQLLGEDLDDAGRDREDVTSGTRDRWLAGAVIACAAGAMIVSLVLSAGSGEAGAPGCGPGSGCAEVLQSRWSRVFGLKTAMLAFFTHVLLVAATWPVAGLAGWQLRTRPLVRQTLAAAVIGAAAWFTWLQAVELEAFCKWCTTAHALGVAAAVLTFVRDGRLKRLQWPAPVIGLLGAAALAVVQVQNPPAATIREAEPPTAEAGFRGDGTGAQPEATGLSLLDGLVPIELATTPAVGPADAPERVAAMLDYACPHCRGAHGLLRERGVRVLVLPVPLNAACNPAFNPGQMPARFDDSCTLAELGLAVFLAGGEAAYARYDEAMFAGDAAPDAAAAEALTAEIAPGLHPEHRERARAAVAANVEAWMRLGEAGIAERVPVLIDTASGRTAVGRLYGQEDLDTLLEPSE